ncbi:MAG: biotin--[acetyl-CoA-carboxylase] ligase [Chloroflexota bacterium]
MLKTRWLGQHYTFFKEIGSTNTELKTAATRAELPEGTVYLTNFQSAGKGRHQRSWVAPPSTSLLFSVLFRPDWPAVQSSWLMMIGCLAASEAIAELVGLDVRVKWPNDLVILQNGAWHKFTGILVEGDVHNDGQLKTAVYGMGMNVNLEAADLPEAITPPTSLKIASGQLVNRTELFCLILEKMELLYEQTKQGASPVADWRKLLVTLGQPVTVTRLGNQARLQGTAVNVDEVGHLIVLDNQGQHHTVQAGDVTLRSNFDN